MNTKYNIRKTFFLQKEKNSLPADISQRRSYIKRLHNAVLSSQREIHKALEEDLKRHPAETDLTEIWPVLNEARHALRCLKYWMRPKKVKTPLTLMGTRSYIYPEAKGIVLILSPWNFPVNLTFCPLISALAAGNRVILKPSEHSPASSAVMQKIIQDLYAPEEVSLFTGDIKVTQSLLVLPFNHIFFTGGSSAAKYVMQAAAKNLSSVTLELGGKSPVIIDESAKLKKAAQRTAWSKFMNSGQVCISPDYVLVHEKKEKEFLALLKTSIQKLYGKELTKLKVSRDYCHIISPKHWNHLQSLLIDAKNKGAKLEVGSGRQADTKSKKNFCPAVLTNVNPESRIMQEEIFGPILPVLPFSSLEKAISFIKQKERPLSLYIYSQKKKNIRKILKEVSAGGGAVNHAIVHFFNPYLPFGGSGASGMGKSHGLFGFQEFSHLKGVLYQSQLWSGADFFMPPYTKLKHKILKLSMRVL